MDCNSHHHLLAMAGQWIVLGALPSLIFLLFLFHLHLKPTTLSPSTNSPPAAVKPPSLSILIGILTRADLYDRRHFLRLIYSTQSSPIAEIHIKFVFCRLTKEEQHVLVGLEILRFDDILLLNCTENMNAGKTYTYLSSLSSALPRRYDYVMKADDDTFIRLHPLAQSLYRLSRRDLYYGFVIPCGATDANVAGGYMSGMGFVLSWDLVEWVAASEIPAMDVVGPEDKLVGRWLAAGGKGRNRYTEKPGMYDYPGTNGRCSHELIPETVVVHRLKRWERWLHVLRYFNVTKGVESIV